jgi:hypothetical protein
VRGPGSVLAYLYAYYLLGTVVPTAVGSGPTVVITYRSETTYYRTYIFILVLVTHVHTTNIQRTTAAVRFKRCQVLLLVYIGVV